MFDSFVVIVGFSSIVAMLFGGAIAILIISAALIMFAIENYCNERF